MKRLTTDNPQGNFEKLMNFAYSKHNRVHLSYADGKEDIDLCEYVSKLAKAKGFDFSPEFIMEDGLFDNYDDDFAVLYYLAVQAAELRSRLKLYEDKLENGTFIELPCKVGDVVYVIKNNKICAKDIVYYNKIHSRVAELEKPKKKRKFRAMTIGEYCKQAECKKCEYHYGAFYCDYSNFNGIYREHSKPYKKRNGKYILHEVKE